MLEKPVAICKYKDSLHYTAYKNCLQVDYIPKYERQKNKAFRIKIIFITLSSKKCLKHDPKITSLKEKTDKLDYTKIKNFWFIQHHF